MKPAALASALLFSTASLLEAHSAMAIDVGTTDADFNHRFEAWGTSLSWWANEVGGQTNTQGREELLDLFFDPDNGLGMNFVRYNIGAGSNPDDSIQNITRPGAELQGFVPNEPSDVSNISTWDFDFNQDATQRLVLDGAIGRGVTQVEAFANSAPWWMTISGSSSGNPGRRNLNTRNYDAFADYLLEVNDHFQNELGIHFETLAPVNEPGTFFWNNQTGSGGGQQQEGMNVPRGTDQNNLYVAFGEAIANAGIDLKLIGLEETSSEASVDSWERLSDEAKSFIQQINTHTYSAFGNTRTTAGSSQELLAAAQTEDVGIYATEFGTGQGATRLARQISADIRYLDAAGWTYWQALEDNNGSGWGLAIANFNGSNDEYDVQDGYFAFKQFSAFIRPGSEIIELSDEGEALDNITAAYDPRTGKTALVVNNEGDQDSSERYSFDLDRNVDSTRLIRTTDEDNSALTNAYQSLANAAVDGSNISFDSAGQSVTTLVVNHRENLIRNGNFDLAGGDNGATSIPGWQSSGDAAFDTGSDHTFDVAGTGTGRLETQGDATEGRLFQTGIGDADTDLTGVAFQLSGDVRFLNGGKPPVRRRHLLRPGVLRGRR